jgi:hypothetical protein
MADFCKTCAVVIWGEDVPGDIPPGTTWLCEGCGTMVHVNEEGECDDPHCPKHGKHRTILVRTLPEGEDNNFEACIRVGQDIVCLGRGRSADEAIGAMVRNNLGLFGVAKVSFQKEEQE